MLLEHDDRFDVFKEFVFYDFAEPFKLPGKPALPNIYLSIQVSHRQRVDVKQPS